MPVTTKIDADRRLVIHAAEGTVSAGDWVKAIADRIQHPDYTPGLDVLWDFSEAPDSILPSRDLRGMLEYSRQEGHGARTGRVALLVPRPTQFAMAAAFERLSDELAVEIRAFRSREQALSWLGEEAESDAAERTSGAEDEET